MIYLYIDEEGCVGKSEIGPTKVDIDAMDDGRLDVLRLVPNDLGHVFVEGLDTDGLWYEIPTARIRKGDGGNEYHDI